MQAKKRKNSLGYLGTLNSYKGEGDVTADTSVTNSSQVLLLRGAYVLHFKQGLKQHSATLVIVHTPKLTQLNHDRRQ